MRTKICEKRGLIADLDEATARASAYEKVLCEACENTQFRVAAFETARQFLRGLTMDILQAAVRIIKRVDGRRRSHEFESLL